MYLNGNSLLSAPTSDQIGFWTEEKARALNDCFEQCEPQITGNLKRLKQEWLSKLGPQTGRILASQTKRNLAGDGVLQVTDSQRNVNLVNETPQGTSRRRKVQRVIWNLQRDNILMELYRESKPIETELLYQAW